MTRASTVEAAPAPPAEMDRLYAAVRVLGRFARWFFFKRVDVRHPERVPRRGPVLLCINHPNNFIDSLLVGTAQPRRVHFLATASIFKNRLLARFLHACGVIPVYRKQDDPAQMGRNVDAFAACFQAFDHGRLVAIFPEGTTHAETRIQPIKTGAARIALGYDARHPGALTVVPVGLSFEARKSFQGRVLVSFGPPLALGPYRPLYDADPVKAVNELTAALQWAMEAEVVHVERIDAADLVRALEELYRDDLVRQLREQRGLAEARIDLFRLSRTIVAAVEHFKTREPDRVERIWHRIQAYRALLARYRVRDEAVRTRLEPRPALWWRLRRSWRALLGLPVFAYGAAVNLLPYLVPRWLARRLAGEETDYATIRLLSGLIAFPLFWGLETWVVARLAGGLWAAAFALSLPVSGLLAYRYLGGAGRLRRAWQFTLLSATHGYAARELVAERQAIVAELDRARDDYLAATRGSSF
jgi:glycerol-3-phosphate O-acyltransferase/dihydroxyacetone phosphate acyltransferase